jgi:hypothetical protein
MSKTEHMTTLKSKSILYGKSIRPPELHSEGGWRSTSSKRYMFKSGTATRKRLRRKCFTDYIIVFIQFVLYINSWNLTQNISLETWEELSPTFDKICVEHFAGIVKAEEIKFYLCI